MANDLLGFWDDAFEENTVPNEGSERIFSFTELRSCYELSRLIKERELELNPVFQRENVWDNSRKTRFIDSLSKGYPIPSLCLYQDISTEKWTVIDGLQRLSAIYDFINVKDFRLSELSDVSDDLAGKTASEVESSDAKTYRRIVNSSISINVIKLDSSIEVNKEFIFTVFHRLNVGSVKLSNQEIRNAIYSGPFIRMINSLNDISSWKLLTKQKKGKSYRMRYQEIILRIFAYADRLNKYNGNMTVFLNRFTQDNRHISEKEISLIESSFAQTSDFVWSHLSDKQIFSEKFNYLVLESIFTAVMKLRIYKYNVNKYQFRIIMTKLLKTTYFSSLETSEGTTKSDKVKGRINSSISLFSEWP